MPEMGEERKARELGLKGSAVYIWSGCPDCGVESWRRRRDVGNRCQKCGRKKMGLGRRLYPEREMRYASELGFTPKEDYPLYKDECTVCGDDCWRVVGAFGRPCEKCARKNRSEQLKAWVGEKHPRFKGYRRMHAGYVMVKLSDDHPFRCMASARDGYVLEHRLVVAEKINRALFPWEIVHHKGTKYPQGSIENKSDNRWENLELLPKQADHIITQRFNEMQAEIDYLKERVGKVEKENARLGREAGRRQIEEIVGEE